MEFDQVGAVLARLKDVFRNKSWLSRTAEGRMRNRIALRWFMANYALEYDQFYRLQALEGAAGVGPDAWWKNPKIGFAKASDRFSGTSIDPSWLSPENSGMFGIVDRTVKAGISRFKLGDDSFDYHHKILMGLGANDIQTDVRLVWKAGKNLSAGIASGKETPRTVGAGLVAKWVVNKIQNEGLLKRHLLEQSLVDEEGGMTDIPYNPSESEKAEGYALFRNIIYGDMTNPVGKAVRDLMRKTFKDSAPMTEWLDQLERGRSLSYAGLARVMQKKLADQTGDDPNDPKKFKSLQNGIYQNHWLPRWRRFAQEFAKSSKIRILLGKLFKAQGISWFPWLDAKDPEFLRNLEENFPLRKRANIRMSKAQLDIFWKA